MAGSYHHILEGWSLIENMGDACEAVKELMWLVEEEIGEKRAKKILHKKFYPMCRGEIKKDMAFLKIEERLSR